MAGRIDWKVSVTPVVTIAASGEGLATETLDADIKGTLGGGNSSGTWAASDTGGFEAQVCTHLTADGGKITTPASCTGVWVKNTGFVYDAAQSDNKGTTEANADSKVKITIGSKQVAILAAGEGMFFPSPLASETDFITLDDVGTDNVAVEYATFV
jgi:hypothetical protein